MSKEELSKAYAEGRISRKRFLRGLAVAGGLLGAVVMNVEAAQAGHLDPPSAGHKKTAKKAPAKKAPPKKTIG